MRNTRLIRRVAMVPLVIGVGACSGESLTCTLIGDPTGLTVELSSRPQGPFTVQVIPQGSSTVAYTHRCDGTAACSQNTIFFPKLVAESVQIQVTTSLGTQTTTVPRVEYRESFPNGKGCEPRALTATVRAQTP